MVKQPMPAKKIGVRILIPHDVHARLAERARLNDRSLTKELMHLIKNSLATAA